MPFNARDSVISSTHQKNSTMIETNTSSKQSASKNTHLNLKSDQLLLTQHQISNIKMHQNKKLNKLRYTCHYNVKRGWSSTPLKTLPGKGSGHKTAWQLLSPANKGDTIFGMFANQPNVKPEGAKIITSNLCFWWFPLKKMPTSFIMMNKQSACIKGSFKRPVRGMCSHPVRDM